MTTMTNRMIAVRSVPHTFFPARLIAATQTSRVGVAAARPTFEPILRASQAGGLCALMDELRRLGTLRAKHRKQVGETSP